MGSWYDASMASVFRWVVSTIWTILIVPVLVLVWRGVLDRGDVASHPADWLMSWLASVAQIPGIYSAALITTGILVGVWIDWFLKKVDGSQASRRETLGVRYCNLSSDVSERQNGYYGEWSTNIHNLKPALVSAFIAAKGFGLWVPVDELYRRQDGGAIMVNYLRVVGTMLRDGHFKEAKKRALEAKDFVAQSTSVEISP
jgi:hypothetical protein